MNRGFRLRRLGLAVPVVLAVGLVGAQLTSAKLSTATYEMADGNLVGSDDWEGLGAKDGSAFPTCGAGTKILCAIDAPSGRGDNSFGNGTKEDTTVPSITTGSIPNNKSDLIRAYMSGEVGSNGDNYLYLAWERVQDPSGSTNMDFELNQSRTLTSNSVTPERTAGDILVSYDLANGGTVPTIGYREWITAASATASAATLCQASTAFPCWGKAELLDSVAREGSINGASVTDPIRVGTQSSSRALSPRTFGEAALNLTAANILPEDGCITFGSVFLKSRSSDSFTAAVKDFIAPTGVEITNCGKVNVTKTDDDGNPLADIDFAMWTATDTDAFDAGVETQLTGATCTTDSSGLCTIYNVPFGDYWLVEDGDTTPDAYETAEPTPVTIDLNNPDGTDVTVVNDRKPGSVTVVKIDDEDTPNPVDGATFQLYTSDGLSDTSVDDESAVTDAFCTTATVASTSGRCTISDVEWGVYWLVETDAPDGFDAAEPVLVEISADNLDITTDPIVDPALFTVVTFVCDNAGSLVSADVDYVDALSATASGSTLTNLDDDADLQSIIEAAICGASDGTVVSQRGSVSADITIP